MMPHATIITKDDACVAFDDAADSWADCIGWQVTFHRSLAMRRTPREPRAAIGVLRVDFLD